MCESTIIYCPSIGIVKLSILIPEYITIIAAIACDTNFIPAFNPFTSSIKATNDTIQIP